jgi:hypothetical protein
MVGTGHNGFLLPVVNWMGWRFTTSFWAKEKQETVSDFLLGDAAGGRRVFSFESPGQGGPMIDRLINYDLSICNASDFC